MHSRSILTFALLAATFGATACNREAKADKDAAPTAQIATETPAQPINQPTTVEGCLRAGEGGTTFVLTAAQSETGSQPATYALTGSGGVNLGDHVGERVSVSGILASQQQASTETPATASKPTGTGGTPTVRTETDLTVRHLDVSSVKSLGERCDTK
ncbi:MAG TPA: hypothetical protein VF147_00625 [Vicinamibacterales bacterium]